MKKILTLVLFFLSSAVYAGAHALYDFETHSFLVRNNDQEVRPIASITKMITAITVINSGVSLNDSVKVNGHSQGHVPKGVEMTRMDLLRAMLISSDNRAAETLANHHPGGLLMFLRDANVWLEKNRLFNTHVVDSSGLLPGNVSTAYELVELLALVKDNSVIRSIAGERQTSVTAPKGRKTLTINLHNTNPEIFTYDNILISKTGFTNPAGRCVLMLVEKGRELYGIVVLGQKNVKERSKLVKELLTVDYIPFVARPKFKTTITDFDYITVDETFTK
jgi:D-alanyl-D-alanine endopeptidase (penicillin-binding protein 7)